MIDLQPPGCTSTTSPQEPHMPATKTTTAATTDAPAEKKVRTPRDPEASELAAAAQALARANGLKSNYGPLEARGVLDRLAVERVRGAVVISKDGGEPVRVKLAALRAVVAG